MASATVLAIALSVATNSDLRTMMVMQPLYVNNVSELPDWVRALRPEVIRIHDDIVAWLCVFGLGLAISTFRPRRRSIFPIRLAPGHLASMLTAIFFLLKIETSVRASLKGEVDISTQFQIIRKIAGISVEFNTLWLTLAPPLTASIVGAWFVSFLSSGRRPPVDMFDRMGRWVGWAWISLLFCRGFVYLLAWY